MSQLYILYVLLFRTEKKTLFGLQSEKMDNTAATVAQYPPQPSSYTIILKHEQQQLKYNSKCKI